jgi:hypothetical protein
MHTGKPYEPDSSYSEIKISIEKLISYNPQVTKKTAA